MDLVLSELGVGNVDATRKDQMVTSVMVTLVSATVDQVSQALSVTSACHYILVSQGQDVKSVDVILLDLRQNNVTLTLEAAGK